MGKWSYKRKIQALIALWIVVTAALFGYFFNILDSSNAALLAEISSKEDQYQQLLAEQESFRQAKQDLEALAKKSVQPDNFFSRDTSLVFEIQTLEALSKQLHLDMTLGVSGSASSAVKVVDTSNVYQVPLSLGVAGDFNTVLRFIDTLEHLPFLVPIGAVSINAAGPGKVNASFSASFYIKK